VGLKFLLLVVLLAVVVGWWFARRRRSKKGPAAKPPVATSKRGAAPEPAAMLACAHCQVHLPQDDAQFDVAGRPYCSAEHRVAGPR
jgi:uncharacterized protein